MIGRALAADADVFAVPATCLNRQTDELLHREVAFVERTGQHAGIAVHAERQLRQVVRADRIAVDQFEELVGEQCVGRNFAHHDYAQTVLAAPQTVLGQSVYHGLHLRHGAHERDHYLDIGQAHLVAHLAHRAAFQRKTWTETIRHIARRAAKADHRVFFGGFV